LGQPAGGAVAGAGRAGGHRSRPQRDAAAARRAGRGGRPAGDEEARMKAVVNGEEWELADGATVGDIVARLGAPEKGSAVACRGEVVPRPSWQDTVVHDGDDIEVLTAVQGG